jgi:hypothetical protein
VNDDISDVDYLTALLDRAKNQAERLPDDIMSQDGLKLTATVMRLDVLRETLQDAWSTLHMIYDEALERDRILDANRTVSGAPSSSGGVVADVLCAAATGIHSAGSNMALRQPNATHVGSR